MSEAKRTGGLYYMRGVPVDSEGNRVADAAPMDADTPADQQPGGTAKKTIAQELAEALAPHMQAASSKAK